VTGSVARLHASCTLAAPVLAGQVAWLILADTGAVVQRGARALPVAMRLDAASGRWLVTELRWWVSENDTGPSSCRNHLGGW
jgi:hypothetical protein